MTPQPLDPISVALSGSHLIEASAGTGKTYAIATLYVRLLLEAQLNVSQILVVTYTNAATAELRLRIRKRLRQTMAALDAGRWDGDATLDEFIRRRCEAGEEARQRDRVLLLQALHTFDEAAIFTIHGFCERVLRENAFESGVGFETELLTDITALIDEIVKDFWVARLHDASPELVRYLDGEGDDGTITPSTLKRIAFVVVTHPDIEVVPELSALDATVEKSHLTEDPPTDLPSPVRPEEAASERPSRRASALAQVSTAFETRPLGSARSSGRTEEVLQEGLPAQALRFRCEFVDYVRRELRRRKEAARVQSFEDLLERLRDALAGAGGADLAALVRDRYRAALIDEFQDTDSVQYDIFRRSFDGAQAPLFLIGDPKQAIYGFRGADVFTYMEAKKRAATSHTLLTNRRSDPSLLRAINTVFERAAPAFLFADIGYERIEPGETAVDRLGGARRGTPPFEFLFVRRDSGIQRSQVRPYMIIKDAAVAFVTDAIASRIAGMLAEGVTLLGDDRERPLVSSDIAVLCRRNQEAHAVQERLRQLGIHAVLQTDATVFESAEAVAVERILRALVTPSDNLALRAALSSSLIGIDAAGLYALENDEPQWDTWARRFREWHDRWLEHGFVAAFRRLLDELEIEPCILARPGGERQLTDVLHLVELLHRAGVEQRLGPEASVQWLARMRVDIEARRELLGDAARIRLESDEAAVKLVTIHRSKGLEYPVVFCPFSWDGTLLQNDEKKALRFHDRSDGNRYKLDLGSSELGEHIKQAQFEALAENLRLLYVAFTRARHYCGVVWGGVNKSETSALAYLLHQDKTGAAATLIERTRERVKQLSDEDMLADLRALSEASDNTIGVVELIKATSAPPRPATPEALLQLPPVRRRDYSFWRTSSFSGLIAAPSKALSSPDEEGVDHDAASATVDKAAAAVPVEKLPFADLRGGARMGDFVHRVLEKLDFEFATADDLRARLDDIVPRAAVERAAFDSLAAGTGEFLETPLGGTAGSLRLRQLPMARRLNELEFILPVGSDGGGRLTVARLAGVFASHAATVWQTHYAQRLERLGFAMLEGYLRGFIDLVFEHDGRWYVVDYKTNFVGPAASDYVSAALENTMALHHYPLQYHLYTVALHRHLAARKPDYDYDRHFGGVYYLFLRGMSQRFPAGNGIWHDRPARRLIEDLSALFAPPAGPGRARVR